MNPTAVLNRRFALRLALVAGLALAAVLAVVFVLDVVRLVLRDSGRSTDSAPVQLVVADVPMSVPRNMIRGGASNGARVGSMDIFFHWPTLTGYSPESAEIFRHGGPDAPIVYVSLSRRVPDLPPAERLARIYRHLFTGERLPGPAGLVGSRIEPGHGYDGDVIYYQEGGEQPYVVRCGEDDARPAPTCQREIAPDPRIAVTYRFPKSLLPQWRELDTAASALVEAFIATAR